MNCTFNRIFKMWTALVLAASFAFCSCASANKAATAESLSQEELWFNKGEQKIYGILYRPEVVNSFGMQLGRAYVEGLYDLDVYGRISRFTGKVQIIKDFIAR